MWILRTENMHLVHLDSFFVISVVHVNCEWFVGTAATVVRDSYQIHGWSLIMTSNYSKEKQVWLTLIVCLSSLWREILVVNTSWSSNSRRQSSRSRGAVASQHGVPPDSCLQQAATSFSHWSSWGLSAPKYWIMRKQQVPHSVTQRCYLRKTLWSWIILSHSRTPTGGECTKLQKQCLRNSYRNV